MGGQNISGKSGWSEVTDSNWTVLRITKAADWVSEGRSYILQNDAFADERGLSTIRIDPNGDLREEVRQAVRRRETEPGRDGKTFKVAKSHILVQIDQRLGEAIESAGIRITLLQDDSQMWHIIIVETGESGTTAEFSVAARNAIRANPNLIKLFNREGEQLTREQASSMIQETQRLQKAEREKFLARAARERTS